MYKYLIFTYMYTVYIYICNLTFGYPYRYTHHTLAEAFFR